MRLSWLIYCSIGLVISINITAFVEVSKSFRRFAIFSSNHDASLSTAEALHLLQLYDKEYLSRHKEDSAKGLKPQEVEFAWLQSLGKSKSNALWIDLRLSSAHISAMASEVVLGIKASTGEQAISTLKNWVTGLKLPRGILNAYDSDGNEVQPLSLSERTVYVKYNSTNNGDAYMKDFAGDSTGVIFQAIVDGEFYQFGDFPLFLFSSSTTNV